MAAYEIIHITTLDDPRLDAYTKLTERELRCVLEPEKGIFIAESMKVIERALAAGMQPVSFLLGDRWLETIQPLLDELEARAGEPSPAAGQTNSSAGSLHAAVAAEIDQTAASHEGDAGPIPVFVGSMDLLKRLTGFSVTRGALCACRRPRLADPRDVLHDAHRVCVLEGIVDHTNVGAIFRSAAALNVDALLVSPTCCDPLYRRAVRVSMGTVFQVPWTRLGTDARHWPGDGIAALHDAGFTCAAMALTDDSVSLDDPRLADIDRLALFMGTEGAGLGARTIEGCDLAVRIPMAHGVDSLNVAAASAVAFWQLCPHASNSYHYQRGIYS